MKKVICYGDSNTFGFIPGDGSRYDSNTRWTGILKNLLGSEFKVLEEGCNNRTGFFLNPDGVTQSGSEYLPQLLENYKVFDIFTLALGTNDVQKFFNIDENIAQNGLRKLISIIKNYNPDARIIVISPVLLDERVLKGYFKIQFDETSIEASKWIQKTYEIVAQEENCELLNMNNSISPSDIDGLHFDKEAHQTIASLVAKQILEGSQKC